MSFPNPPAGPSSQSGFVAQTSFSTENPSVTPSARNGLNLRHSFPTENPSPAKKSGPLSLNLTEFFHTHQPPVAPEAPLFPPSDTPSPSLGLRSLTIFSPEPCSSGSEVSSPISASPSATSLAGLQRSASGPEPLPPPPVLARTTIPFVAARAFPTSSSIGLSPIPLIGSTRSASGLAIPFPRFTASSSRQPTPIAYARFEDLSPPQSGRTVSGGSAIPSTQPQDSLYSQEPTSSSGFVASTSTLSASPLAGLQRSASGPEPLLPPPPVLSRPAKLISTISSSIFPTSSPIGLNSPLFTPPGGGPAISASPRQRLNLVQRPLTFSAVSSSPGFEDLSPPQLSRASTGGPAVPSVQSQDLSFTEPTTPLSAEPRRSAVTPSSAGFEGEHNELRMARTGLLSPPPFMRTPATPQVKRPSIHEKYKNSAFIQNARITLKLIREKLIEKAEKQKELGEKACFEPFNLDIAPGISRRITDIKPLMSSGRHAQVYRCEVEGEDACVIKLYQDEILDNPLEAVKYAASQLFRYAQNRRHPILDQHTVPHANFELHLESVKGFLSEKSQFKRTELFKKYVLENMKQGFLFCPYIENEFPLAFDAENSAWKQLKDLFQESFKARIINDLRRSNVRIDANGKVWLIDLMEVDADEDEFSPYVPELIRTFTDQEEQQKWLSPSLELP